MTHPDASEIDQDPAAVLTDKLAIRDLVDQWIIASDSGLWDLFDEVWHEDGVMAATWLMARSLATASRSYLRNCR